MISQVKDEEWSKSSILAILQHQQHLERKTQPQTCEECSKHGITSRTSSFLSFSHLSHAVDLMQSDVIKRIPPIMTVSCIYSSPSQSESVFYNILSCILSPTISTLQLRAFVCYRGVHYICFCKEYASNNELSVWVEYDDCRKKCFSSHTSLIQYCIETLSLPVLLLFSKVRWKEMRGSSKDDYL